MFQRKNLTERIASYAGRIALGAALYFAGCRHHSHHHKRTVEEPEPPAIQNVKYIRGDVTNDGKINLSNAISIENYLFIKGPEPICLDSADVDDNGIINASDEIYLLNHLFKGGAQPPEPYEILGKDPTEDYLDCKKYVLSDIE